ncbi:MAG: DUF1064 domain-containing protein [Bacteroidales bacterium]|nr:DUF1064 domain-containing protein [Bacteroidales bacterium]
MRSKYGNRKVEVDGIRFDSKKEAGFYLFLKDGVRKGEISDLRLQVPFELIPAIWEDAVIHLKTRDKVVTRCVQKAVHYVADFVFTETATGKEVVVDVKGGKATRTPEYRLKRKMMRALKGIEITEV